MQKPFAIDWTRLGPDLEHSKEVNLYWVPSTRRIYDERSAHHNGLIGLGAQLRTAIKQTGA